MSGRKKMSASRKISPQMRAVKINIPYVAYPLSHKDLTNGTLLAFNAYINSMTRFCICRYEKSCPVPPGIIDTSSITTNDNQHLIIFIKQTEIEPVTRDKRVLNSISSVPRLMIGHVLIDISKREVWENDMTMKKQTDFMDIITFCKHQAPDDISRIGYERVMMNALLRFSDRLCNEHYQWIAVDYKRDDLEVLIKILTDYGFGKPYPTQSSITGVAYSDIKIALFKMSTHMGNNETENKINAVKAFDIKTRLMDNVNDSMQVVFDEKTINNLRLMPFFVTGTSADTSADTSNQVSGPQIPRRNRIPATVSDTPTAPPSQTTSAEQTTVTLCVPTTPISETEIQTIVEYGGKFIISDAGIDDQGKAVYKISMSSPPEGFYNYSIGEAERITNVPEGSMNFHTHPYYGYVTRFPTDVWSTPTAKNPQPVMIKGGSKMVIMPPSTGDYAHIYTQSVVNKHNPIQFHSVITVEGIWTISVNKHVLSIPNYTGDEIARMYNIDIGLNDINSSIVDPSEMFGGYSGSNVDETRVTRAVNDYLALIAEYNSRFGNLFTVQYHSWKHLSSGGKIVHGGGTIAAARIQYTYDVDGNPQIFGWPLALLEDYQSTAMLYPTVDPRTLYEW